MSKVSLVYSKISVPDSSNLSPLRNLNVALYNLSDYISTTEAQLGELTGTAAPVLSDKLISMKVFVSSPPAID